MTNAVCRLAVAALVLAPKSQGAAAKKSYTMRAKMIGGSRSRRASARRSEARARGGCRAAPGAA
jgi:hypothetical protein